MRNTVAAYRRLLGGTALAVAGGRVRETLARLPDLVAEIEGIAAGAGVDAAELLAVNARTELLVGTRQAECSLAGRVAGGRVRLAQTWDWHPDLAPSLVCWTVLQPGGRWFVTVTEAGILGKLGLSSEGLAVGLNFLGSSLDRGVGGMPVHVLLRVLLDRTDSLFAALELLRTTVVGASACITVGWSDGVEAGAASAELSPAGAAFVWPGRDGRLAHANHFLTLPEGATDIELTGPTSTLLRQWQLERAAADEPIEAVLRSHAGAPQSICRHACLDDEWSERRATLAAVVIDPARPSLRVADGPPCERPFREIALP